MASDDCLENDSNKVDAQGGHMATLELRGGLPLECRSRHARSGLQSDVKLVVERSNRGSSIGRDGAIGSVGIRDAPEEFSTQ